MIATLQEVLGLNLSVPGAFFILLSQVGDGSPVYLGAAAVAGALGLLAGTLIGILRGEARLFRMLLSPLASHAFVTTYALFPGLRGLISMDTALIVLGSGQLGLLAILILMLKGARLPALLLAAFGLSYALYAWLVVALSPV